MTTCIVHHDGARMPSATVSRLVNQSTITALLAVSYTKVIVVCVSGTVIKLIFF